LSGPAFAVPLGARPVAPQHAAVAQPGGRNSGDPLSPEYCLDLELVFCYNQKFNRVLKNKHQAVSQGVRRFGKRSIFGHM